MSDSLAEMLDERRHLIDIATWLFGSETAADQIVQETYRRWYALTEAERAAIAQPRAWLTRVAGGICLELLAAGTPHPPPVPRTTPRPRPGLVPPARHDEVVHRFAAACSTGDAPALRAVLSPDVLVVSDGGGKVRAPLRPTHGAEAVARFLSRLLSGIEAAVEPVNGRTGLVLRQNGRAVAVVSVSVAATEVTAVWIVLNPDKLKGWHRP
ncbi:sigma factor [Herbidospora yilanensis]|uniref:sigma factor n=1 Tax=Herbidospora yilanensis TaxID=354426 RepID=UPI0009FCF0FA|nr:sigma factor [Herbidospora yilanensis]